MARFLHPFRRALLFCSSPCSCSYQLKTLVEPCLPTSHPFPLFDNPSFPRSYITEMRKSAFQENLLRILRTEIDYELETREPKQPVAKFNSFTVEECPGDQWIRLRRKYGSKEDIKAEITMFDAAVPTTSPANTDDQASDMKLHVTMLVEVSKGEDYDCIFNIICSLWPDSLNIQKVFLTRRNQTRLKNYMGPFFKELNDEVQEALQEYLEERGFNDELAAFVHEYMLNKDATELVRWMGKIMSYVEK